MRRTATSVVGSRPTSCAAAVSPPGKMTVTSSSSARASSAVTTRLGRQTKPLDRARWECTLTTAGAVLATSSESARERPSRRVGEAEFDMRGLPGCPQCAHLRRARLLPGWLGRKLSLVVARRSGPLLGQAPALPARGRVAWRSLQHGADPIWERRNDASQESGFRPHSRGRVRLPYSTLDCIFRLKPWTLDGCARNTQPTWLRMLCLRGDRHHR